MSHIQSQTGLQEHQRAIVHRYYDHCERDFQILWGLDHNASMHAGFWDAGIRSVAQAVRHQDLEMAREIGIGPDDRVLDAGCGFGGSAVRLAMNFGCRIVGLTIVPRQVEAATRYAERHGAADRATFIEGDFTAMGCEDGSFDVVWALESISHTSQRLAFACEAHRVLRPGGRIIIADVFRGDRTPRNDRDAQIDRITTEGFGLQSLDTIQGVVDALEKAGFINGRGCDVTCRVVRASRRLYWASYPAQFWNACRAKRGKVQMDHAIAARNLHRAFGRDLWCYGMITARRH